MVNRIELEGTGGRLQLDTTDEWCKCYLNTAANQNQYLGAERTQYVVSHLLTRLADPSTEIIGEFAGQKVKWILSLAEGTSILYAAMQNADRVLLWQDAKAKLIATFQLSPDQWAVWCHQLIEVSADSR
jgi:hypothetical protein